jgi:protease I
MGTLDGKRIAFLATDGVEQVELTEPLKAVRDAGAEVDLISLEKGEFQGFNHLDKGDAFTADKAVADANADDYDGIVQPGGVANPDFLRMNPDAVAFFRAFFEAKKPAGVICHGPWMLIEADVVNGRTVTSWPSLKTDLRLRRSLVGRRGARGGRGPRVEPQAGRPRCVLRQGGRGDRRRRARGPAGERAGLASR